MKKITIQKLDDQDIESRGISEWPIWEKEVSEFDWEYDTDEECLILDGEVEVKTDEGTFHIRKGDFVTFKKGLRCVWNVTKGIRKHYNFK